MNATSLNTAHDLYAGDIAGGQAIYGAPVFVPPPSPPTPGIVLVGGPGNDWLNGSASDDKMNSAGGNDTLIGNAGNDELGGGGDVIMGGDGNDERGGGLGNDDLQGGWGNDVLFGEPGIDFLTGGVNDDILIGGADGDFLVFTSGHMNDTIVDFQVGLDHILLQGLGATITQAGPNTIIFTGSGSIALLNVSSNSLPLDAILFR